MKVVADFLHRAVQLSLVLQKEAGTKMLKDFCSGCYDTGGEQGGLRQGPTVVE